MSCDSQASFSNTVKSRYRLHCSICLCYAPEVTTQSAHLIDSATAGASQLSAAVKFGLLSAQYERSSDVNGTAQCAGCHIGYFTPNLIALSPPLPVLKYILRYLEDTPAEDRMPLYMVFELLQLAMTGADVTLPDLDPVLPYLRLFSLVILKPDEVHGRCIVTHHLPMLSILRNNRFETAPDGTSAVDENVAQIFDVLSIMANHPPPSFGPIPLSPVDPTFQQQRYWRLPVNIGAILAALIVRVGELPFESEEINYVQDIAALLRLQWRDEQMSGLRGGAPGLPPGGGCGSGDNGGASGSGTGGGEAGRGKRILRNSNPQPPANRGRKKGGLGRKDALESRVLETEAELSDQSDCPERDHHGVHPDDWEVASSFSTIGNDESMRTSCPFEDPWTRSSKSDTEDNPNDPSTWQFGPSYRSDMIIVAARGISLV